MHEIAIPRIGIGVFIFKNNHFLMGLRKGSHGSNTWGLPGGHLEYGEEFKETAEREALEETGLSVKNFKQIHCTNDIFLEEKKHYLTLFMACNWLVGEPEIMEPDKCLEWRWFEWGNELPENLFIPVQNFLKLGIDPRQHLKVA